MRHVIPPNFVLLYDIALHGFNQGKPIYKTFSFANFFIFTNQATTQQQSFAYLHYFWLENKKRSFSRNSIFSLLFFGYQSHFYMTLVSNSPHVASILRVNISKLGCALQANFIYAIALTSLRSSGSISLSSVAPYRLISFTLQPSRRFDPQDQYL